LGCSVHSFEMQDAAADLFSMSVLANSGFRNRVTLHRGVIFSHPNMHFDITNTAQAVDENVGGVTMMFSEPEEGPGDNDQVNQVNTVVIQDEIGFDTPIAVMKVDVEGSEALVLESTQRLWKYGKIAHIILETRRSQLGMFSQLYEANYICGFGSMMYENNTALLTALDDHLSHSLPMAFVDTMCNVKGK